MTKKPQKKKKKKKKKILKFKKKKKKKKKNCYSVNHKFSSKVLFFLEEHLGILGFESHIFGERENMLSLTKNTKWILCLCRVESFLRLHNFRIK